LVYDLYVEDIFFRKTLQIDFRHSSGKWKDENLKSTSRISFNGHDKSNLDEAELEERGVRMEKNKIKDGKWLISLDGAWFDEQDFY